MSDATVLSYKQTLAALTDLFASGIEAPPGAARLLAAMVDGPPGTGKTMLAQYVQEALHYQHRFMIKPGHHDPIDFQGVPVPHHDTKMTYFYPSGDLLPPSDLKGGCVMVWDEVPDAAQMIQNLVCQGVFEGGLHGYIFPNDVAANKPTIHLITGNRVSDRSGAQRVITKLGNRVAWITLKPTVDELFDYGVKMGWNPALLAFLKLKGYDPINPNDRPKDGREPPTYFNSFDPNDPAQSIKPVFASSRSYEFTSNLLNYIDKYHPKMGDGDLLARIAALLGTPVATALVPFRSESSAMPDPDAILKGEKVAFPKKQSVLWTLTISLVSRVQKNQWKHMDAWLKQGPAEFRILAVRMAFDTKAAKLIGPDFNASLQEADVKQALTAK